MCGMDRRHETATFGNFSCIVLHTLGLESPELLTGRPSFNVHHFRSRYNIDDILSNMCTWNYSSESETFFQGSVYKLGEIVKNTPLGVSQSWHIWGGRYCQAVVVLRYHASSSFGLFCLLLKLCCSLQKFIPKTRPDFATFPNSQLQSEYSKKLAKSTVF